MYKVIAFIDSFCPQYTCLTLDGHGQTVVIPTPREADHSKFTRLEEISDLNYVDMLLLKEDLLKPREFQYVLDQIIKTQGNT